MSEDFNIDLGGLWEKIRSRLEEKGIHMDFKDGLDFSCVDPSGSGVKVVCVAPDLKRSVEEMGRSPRDQVVMVRVDEATLESLDAWVATGAVKSRSEAAALFIREGLEVRADELAKLRDALREVKEAQERLKARAREIFGEETATAGDDAGGVE
jgi:Arc/MetJ-type ribon-helix-helix transcriptional regulator